MRQLFQRRLDNGKPFVVRVCCDMCGQPTDTQPDRPPAEDEAWLCFGCRMTIELRKMADDGDSGAAAIITNAEARSKEDTEAQGVSHDG